MIPLKYEVNVTITKCRNQLRAILDMVVETKVSICLPEIEPQLLFDCSLSLDCVSYIFICTYNKKFWEELRMPTYLQTLWCIQ